MGFANAALAGFLALAALPILVHLMFRRKTKTIRFPSLRLLKRVDPHLARRRKIHEILLLALRTAAILLAVLAVLRPHTGAVASGPTSADRVVLVDDTASMALGGDAPAFAEAVSVARSLFDRMAPGDRSALHAVVAGRVVPSDGLTQDARTLKKGLDGLERSDARGSLAAAVRRAGEALAKGTSPNRRLVILSDLDAQALSEPDLAAAVRALPPGTQVVVGAVSRPPAPKDVAVSKAAVASAPCVVGRPFRVAVTVERRAGAVTPVTVHLAAGTAVPLSKEASPAAGSPAEVVFDVTPTAPGPVQLVASVDADDFTPNDRFHLLVDVKAKVVVSLLDADLDDPAGAPALGGGALIALALDPPGDGSLSGIQVRRRASSDLAGASIADADAIVLHDVPDLPEDAAQAVRARFAEGAGLLVVAGKRAARANRAVPESLDDLLPARTSPPASDEEPAPLTVAAPDDPLLAGLAPPGGRATLEGITVRAPLVATTRSSAVTLLAARGRPVCLKTSGGPAPCVLLAMPLDPDETNFALRPTFLAFLHGLVPRLSRGGASRASFVAGEMGGPRVVAKAGFFDVDRGDAAFAVNADGREANASRLDAEGASLRFGGSALVVAARDVTTAVDRGSVTDLTGIFLALAAAALLAETLLANAGRRRLDASVKALLSQDKPSGAKAVA